MEYCSGIIWLRGWFELTVMLFTLCSSFEVWVGLYREFGDEFRGEGIV